MFESLGDRLQNAINKIKGYGKITEDNISEVTREIRLALLEADVNYKVVKEFVANVKEKALGEEVKKSLKPSEVFIKIVRDELIDLLGREDEPLIVIKPITVLMMTGLQGSGKTTTAGKLALHLRKKLGLKPLLVACDVYRPAAIDQLKQLGRELNIEVYDEGKENPVQIAKNAVNYARENGYNYVIIDTAGRLHIDEELMDELKNINEAIGANEILLVIDSMTGQDAVNVIEGFNEKLPLTGAILTKLDGDTKGGAALSIRHLTNIPIKFVGTSEKMDGLEPFRPVSMANRILDMGDLMSIADKAESLLDDDEALRAAEKMSKGKFDLEDFLVQLNSIKKLGPLENILKMIPGAKKMGLSNVNIDPKQMSHIEAIILSMTPMERKNPDILKASRKKRVAAGCGQSVEDVNRLLKQFEQMKSMMKQFKNGNLKLPF
ncbi:MAG: signal recognition particle protein [Bacilli bacterium]|nr:signal recognition particle protein [Bacilli bacterium]